jgi:hypothetical protein
VIADLDFVLPREREAAGDVDGGRCASVIEVALDLLQNNTEEPVREKRRVGRGMLEGEGKAPAHRRRRIRPVLLAR